MATTIRTNHRPRHFLYANELTEKEKKDFDWVDFEQDDGSSFFRYRGNVYHLSQFIRLNETPGWEGGMSENAFAAVLVKRVEIDHEWMVIVGRQLC